MFSKAWDDKQDVQHKLMRWGCRGFRLDPLRIQPPPRPKKKQDLKHGPKGSKAMGKLDSRLQTQMTPSQTQPTTAPQPNPKPEDD